MADKDKRSTQISLPMDTPARNLPEVVKQHWKLTFAKQKKTTVVAKRMWNNMLAQINEDGFVMKPYYQMQAHEVVKNTDGGSSYEQCRKAFKEMAETVWMVEDLESKYFAPRNLIDTTKRMKKDGFESNYDDGLVTIAPNPALEEYVLEMAHWSKYERHMIDQVSSWYSTRMWEILSAWEDKLQKGEKWYADINEFRGWMDCEKKHKHPNKMIEVTLSEPIKELKGSRLEFGFDKVYGKMRRGRPRLVGLDFYLVNPTKPKSDSATLEGWGERSPDHKRCIDKGREWKINDRNLVLCLPIITEKGAWKIYNEFSQKQTSNDRMNDISKWCNAAFLRDAGLKKD